jgi:V/A-type H+-transporting ATPase subunit F
MNLYVLGNQDAVWGFALTGVHGQVISTPDELHQALDSILGDKDVGIVLVTEDVADLARQRVDELVIRSRIPIVVEIPGPEGTSPERPSLSELIRRTIGIRV